MMSDIGGWLLNIIQCIPTTQSGYFLSTATSSNPIIMLLIRQSLSLTPIIKIGVTNLCGKNNFCSKIFNKQAHFHCIFHAPY